MTNDEKTLLDAERRRIQSRDLIARARAALTERGSPYHVIVDHRNGGWCVMRDGTSFTATHRAEQEQALAIALRLAQVNRSPFVVVHELDGSTTSVLVEHRG